MGSLSNLLLSFVLAREVSISAFGAFGIAFAIYQLLLGVSRAVVGEPTLLRGPRTASDASRAKLLHQSTLGSSLVVGTAGAALCLVVGLVAGGEIGQACYPLAVGLPGLMMLDGMRYWEFARATPRTAAALDIGWLISQIIGFVLVIWFGIQSLPSLMLAWAAGAYIAIVIYIVLQRLLPSLRGAMAWFYENRDMSPRFLGEYLMISGIQQSILLLTLFFAGLVAVGAIRAGQVIMGPVNVVSVGIAVVVLPMMARKATESTSSLKRISVRVSSFLTVSMLLAGVGTQLIPDSWGEFLLGDNWENARQLAPLIAIMLAINGISYGATSGLRAMNLIRQSFWLRLAFAPIVIVSIAYGAFSGGAEGAIWGFIIAGSVQAMAWWSLYLSLAARRAIGKS